MRRVLLIGIGAGDPEYVTVQAIRALNEVDVFFVTVKGEETQDLVGLRREVCERYIDSESYRMVEIRDPERDRASPRYRAAVDEWRRARADLWEGLIRDQLSVDDVGAFLVWGDPSLYDSTLAVLDEVRARGGVEFAVEVIPGISAVAALTARHGIALNRVGEPVHITTGRRLAREGLPDDVRDIVVMLDAHCSFRLIADGQTDIYWGAYLGTPDELLVSGDVGEVADEIERVRAQARERKGWIMDTYLLRRRGEWGGDG
jgi:precorrin-6A synthase